MGAIERFRGDDAFDTWGRPRGQQESRAGGLSHAGAGQRQKRVLSVLLARGTQVFQTFRPHSCVTKTSYLSVCGGSTVSPAAER